jgi:hypothetical protein
MLQPIPVGMLWILALARHRLVGGLQPFVDPFALDEDASSYAKSANGRHARNLADDHVGHVCFGDLQVSRALLETHHGRLSSHVSLPLTVTLNDYASLWGAILSNCSNIPAGPL